jgi:hypothetical protein
MDEENKLLSLVSVGYTVDKELAEIQSLQSEEEASYDQDWQGLIGRESILLSQTTVERCLLQTLRVDYMHTSHETLTLTSAWWPPWD